MGRVIIAPTIKSNALERFGYPLEFINQCFCDTLATSCLSNAKMNYARSSTSDPIEGIAEIIPINIESDDYLA